MTNISQSTLGEYAQDKNAPGDGAQSEPLTLLSNPRLTFTVHSGPGEAKLFLEFIPNPVSRPSDCQTPMVSVSGASGGTLTAVGKLLRCFTETFMSHKSQGKFFFLNRQIITKVVFFFHVTPFHVQQSVKEVSSFTGITFVP